MSQKTKQPDNCSFRVDLDSEIRTLSGRSLKSLLGLFAHLESLGMRQAKKQYAIAGKSAGFMSRPLKNSSMRRRRGDESQISLVSEGKVRDASPRLLHFRQAAKSRLFKSDRMEPTCFRKLGRQALCAAKSQVRVLRARAQEIQSLLLINDWPVAERLWPALLLDCKTPLFVLSFLEELWEIHPDRLEFDGRALARHWHQFILVQAEVEIHLSRRQSLVELSDALEAHLGPWLKQFGEILEKLDEESVA